MPTVFLCAEILPTGSQGPQLPAAESVTGCSNKMKRLQDSPASRPVTPAVTNGYETASME